MRLEDKSPALAELTDAQREQAMTRFRVLRSHVERGVPLPRAAQAAGVGLRTVERWLAQYRADGLTGLVRRTREDRGRRRLPVEAVELMKGCSSKSHDPLQQPSTGVFSHFAKSGSGLRLRTAPSTPSSPGLIRG